MSLASIVGSSVTRTVPTTVGLLIDESYSMMFYGEIVTKSLSLIVADQQKMKDVHHPSLLLSTFSDDYQKILDKKFSDINPNNFYNFKARGYTCLYRSIFDITKDMENKIEKMESKPKRVLMGIFTDGEDSGCGQTADDVKKLIEEKQKLGWEYLFLGAPDNSVTMAGLLGISDERAVSFGNNFEGSLKLLNNKITEVRKGKILAISDKEKRELLTLPSTEL